MKTLIIIVCLTLFASVSFAEQNVNGYFRQDGTYVQPYTRSAPDSSYNNNYSARGNSNPYTNERGTNAPTYNDRTPDYNNKTFGNPGTLNNNWTGSGRPSNNRKSLYGN